TGAGRDDDIDAFSHVLGRRRSAPTRLVVGMRMHFQQPQALALGVDTECGTKHDRHAATSCLDCAARCPVAEMAFVLALLLAHRALWIRAIPYARSISSRSVT